MFRKLRILLLLLILATVAQSAWLAHSRATDWHSTLQVAVYPIDADGSPAVAKYIASLAEENFDDVEAFLAREAQRHGVTTLRPVDVSLAPPIAALPPVPPRHPGMLDVVSWSLRLRWWAWRNDTASGPAPQVRMFVLYHDAAVDSVQHSVALVRGLIGLVNGYGARSMAAQNNVVIAHELLHTLGATDKYDPVDNLPRHPDGYAEPERVPLHPQSAAEIMGGRIPLSAAEAEMPASLDEVIVGAKTAAEIGWLR
jgi:hypothetical protein